MRFVVECPCILLPRSEEGVEVRWGLVFDDVPRACEYAVFCDRVCPLVCAGEVTASPEVETRAHF